MGGGEDDRQATDLPSMSVNSKHWSSAAVLEVVAVLVAVWQIRVPSLKRTPTVLSDNWYPKPYLNQDSNENLSNIICSQVYLLVGVVNPFRHKDRHHTDG